MLQQVEPEYLELVDIMETGPTISATLSKRVLRWQVRIHEDWGNTPSENQYQYYTANDRKVAQRINWATEQLVTWKFVKRISYDQWIFFNKRSAEKFITLFNLRWAR
jgi:hypothetical protein